MNPNITSNPSDGVDITITLTAEEAAALGSDIATFADWIHTALVALAGLRDLPLSAYPAGGGARPDLAVGDRVRYVSAGDPEFTGRTGTVSGLDQYSVTVKWDWTEGAGAPYFTTPRKGLSVINEDGQGEEAPRDGVAGLGWHTIINTIDRQLLPRLEGIRDAAIRASTANGYSHRDLALALDVVRATAQSRRAKIVGHPLSTWETWATSGGPQKNFQL